MRGFFPESPIGTIDFIGTIDYRNYKHNKSDSHICHCRIKKRLHPLTECSLL